jgi:predicted O-linked N-acetylglucosamine transferase (SPINDLY family)
VHYLGFPGTLGYDAIDGNIADAIVAPPEEDCYFHERVLRLPRCYFVTDGERDLPSPQSRAALGFSADDVVLVSFNQAYKLTRRFFDVWLDVLEERPNTLLWLYVPAPAAQANIHAYAAERGIAAGRVRFASKVSQDEHIARLACADLALDVLPYSSHTTACDALWAGVPMLSCRGTTFAGRVGESILNAVGLRELVATDLDDYRSQLQSLAADRERLGHYKRYLDRERRGLPLFDTQGFTRDFEALLERAYEDIPQSQMSSR